MRKKILVPLAQRDRIEEMIPYIEKVARPGMKVVFLMRYPVCGIQWPRKEPDTETTSEIKELLGFYSWGANVKRAKAEVACAVEVLGRKGIEAVAEVYAGSLNKAVRSYTVKADVHLILTRAGVSQRIASFLSGNDSLSDLFAPSKSPVLLTHPGTAA